MCRVLSAHGCRMFLNINDTDILTQKARGCYRIAGKTLDVVGAQIAGSVPQESEAGRVVIAYEPVWAIGTGKTPTANDVQEVHAFMRQKLADLLGAETAQQMQLLYGGSVKPSNAEELLSLPDVDGALVGGASLKVDDFWAIAQTVM